LSVCASGDVKCLQASPYDRCLTACAVCLCVLKDRWFVLSGNYLMQYSSDTDTQSPQSLLFLKNHTVKELAAPDTCSDDSQKFVFEISSTVGELPLQLSPLLLVFLFHSKSSI